MIQGVNHQIIEITRPECEYFERVIFFVKPEFSAVSQGTLRERAGKIAGETGCPPPTKLRRQKFLFAGKLAIAAVTGAAISIIINHFI